jgi:hypothetical protein
MDFTSIETIVGRTGAMVFVLANVLQSHHSSQLGRRAPCGGRSGVSIFWLTPSTNSLKRVNRNTPFSVNASRISVHLSATPPLGMSLGAAFCGVWVQAAENLQTP